MYKNQRKTVIINNVNSGKRRKRPGMVKQRRYGARIRRHMNCVLVMLTLTEKPSAKASLQKQARLARRSKKLSKKT
jgi:hypothetical protein